MSAGKINSSASLEPNTLNEGNLERAIYDLNSFQNSVNSIQEKITFSKDENHNHAKKTKK